MKSNIRIQLNQARKLYDEKQYAQSLELYEKLYSHSPEKFSLDSRISYSWAIYQVRVKDCTDEDELYDAVEFITQLVPQANLNRQNTCPYTFSVLKVLDFLYKRHEYYNIFEWIFMLDPNLLDENRTCFKGRTYRSRKEKFYDYASKSYLECAEWEQCIKISTEALDCLKTFTNDSDTWHRWRIAKALKEMHRNGEAIKYLSEVVKVRSDWFVFKEILENYHIMNDDERAVSYIAGAVLSDDPIKMKVNLFYLIYEILKDSDRDIAIKHARMYRLLKLDTNSEVSSDIEELLAGESEIEREVLLSQINEYWSSNRGDIYV